MRTVDLGALRYFLASWAAAVLLALGSVPLVVQAQSVTRGPYLQMGTATSQMVRWRTDVATDSRVRIGTSPDQLDRAVDLAGSFTEDVVRVTGLEPNTRYYYAIGSSGAALAGGDANHFFITPPSPGTADPTRIWVLGDAGTAGPTGTNANQTAVKNAYANFTGTRYTA
jgi:hypothetical protein